MTMTTGTVDKSWLYTLPERFQAPAYPIGGLAPAGNAYSSPSRESVAGSAGVPASTREGTEPQTVPSRPSSSHLSIVGGLGGPKGQRMTGQIYVRCETCSELHYDPRTGKCGGHE